MQNFKMRRVAAFLLALVLCALSWVQAAPAQRELVPLGITVGMKIEPGGLLISKLDVVSTLGGSVCPARQAGLAAGDIIVSAGGKEVESASELEAQLKNSGGELSLGILRHGTRFETVINPVKDEAGQYKMGLVLKESVEGIGTLTYYDPQTGNFAGLGHGIVDAGVLVPAKDGIIRKAKINAVQKGKKGAAGHLEGTLLAGNELGKITANLPQGVFGTGLESSVFAGIKPVPIAVKDEVSLGSAQLLASPAGEGVQAYSIEITRIDKSADAAKQIELKVTDPALSDLTGGIVQGMSGSVICQNGKIVGAVTHVLVNDPTRGYGIFIGNMLEAAE